MKTQQAVIALATLTIAVSGFLFWNYTETIKDKNQIERERIRSQEIERDTERRLEEDRATAQQRDLDSCLADAQSVYSANWDSSCLTKYEETEKGYKGCLAMNFDWATPTYCRSTWPAVLKADCTLPSTIYKRWDDMLAADKDACYRRYK